MPIHPCDRARASAQTRGGWETTVLWLLILIPIAFNAIWLLPEVSVPTPPVNDDALHYMLVQQASMALARGDNPFDFWVPNLGLGFPQFHYYQHLPHLAVVLLYRLLLEQIDLLTLFNAVRYLLLVAFPVTVYWSMRMMEFSVVGAATGAVCASLISASHRSFGFNYESYLGSGFGLYTQLWAMHLLFISLACLQRLLRQGSGYAATILAFSALVLSHVFYSYMAAATALVLVLANLVPEPLSAAESRANHGAALLTFITACLRRVPLCVIRLVIVGLLSAVITSYFWLPFLLLDRYFNWVQFGRESAALLHPVRLSPTGIAQNWQLLDNGRPPVLTLLVVIGTAYAVCARTAPARMALAVFIFWSVLYFGLSATPGMAVLLPMHETVPFARFTGGVDLGAILLMGLGGEWIWRQAAPLAEPCRAVVPGLVILVLITPALRERLKDYAQNALSLEWFASRDLTVAELPALLSTLSTLPPARTYCHKCDATFNGKRLSVRLAFYNIVTISPGQRLSLNSRVIFDDRNSTDYNLFNAKYVLASRFGPELPAFLIPIKKMRLLTLYRTETSGFAEFVAVRSASITSAGIVDAQRFLFRRNQEWLQSSDPGAGKFIGWDYPPGVEAQQHIVAPGGPGSGTVTEERVFPDRIDLSVDCREAATLVIKITYHPNWRVTIDGREKPTFMLSPSYLGVEVPPGHHEIHAEYRSSPLKKFLLLLGASALIATIALRRRLSWLETIAKDFASEPIQRRFA